ncbi:MAG: GH3 auxin-responsive promoter family protein [Spirochaetia bacterium]|jgi:hypothetical protein
MLPEDVYFKTLDSEELWKRYCGFLDLTVEDFVQIQRSLLAEELSLVADSTLGRKILGARAPLTIEEFRQSVPFTTYSDYEPYLGEKRENALAAKPAVWCHSSGRGGKFKWIPHSEPFMEKAARNCVAAFILSAASRRGEIALAPGVRILTVLPLAPYTSGTIFEYVRKRFTFQPLPPPESVESSSFPEQVSRAFEMALRDGFDFAGAIASVLVRMGAQMAGHAARTSKLSLGTFHPKVLFRLLRGLLRSRIQNRPVYPRDLWSPKGILAGGVDVSIYRDDIEKYWGVTPFDMYISTETLFVALQSWAKAHMTFLPDSVFLEFVPHSGREGTEPRRDRTLLLDQLEPGGLYEVIVTQFHGMPLLRYRLGDVIRVVSIGDEKTGIKLPQVEVRRKVGEAINLGSLCNLDERALWSAIAASGIPYAEWTAMKEYDHHQTFLRLVIELKEPRTAAEVSRLVHNELKKVDLDYVDVEKFLGVNPVRTTIISTGSFARYVEARIREGAVLSHLKPAHVNPSPEMLKLLVGEGSIVDEERLRQ